MKIYAASIQTETNTFSPVPTSREMFEETYKTFRGQDPVNPNFWGAPMVEFQKLALDYGDEYVEGLCVAAEPAGIVPKDVYEEYRDEILRDLKMQMPVDMVLLNLHGAMVADNYDDCEGDFIQCVRKVVGKNIPIGVELDLHTHLTERMVREANLIIGFKLYPHTDVADRACELYHFTRKIALKKLELEYGVYDCQMINLFPTGQSPIRELVEELFSIERTDDKVVSISFLHGFIWGDVPDLGAKMLVYTDKSQDPEGLYANKTAEMLGKKLYAVRKQTELDLISVNELITILDDKKNTGLVIADFSDNPGLGGMGDATFILEAILDGGINNVIFATIFDPTVVETAFQAGIGQTIKVFLGGHHGSLSGKTIHIDALVKYLNPSLIQTFSGLALPLGKAVVLEIGGNDVIVNSLRSQVYSPDTITNMGITIENKKAVVVKSCEHFREKFAPLARKIFRVFSPGVGNTDIKNIRYLQEK